MPLDKEAAKFVGTNYQAIVELSRFPDKYYQHVERELMSRVDNPLRSVRTQWPNDTGLALRFFPANGNWPARCEIDVLITPKGKFRPLFFVAVESAQEGLRDDFTAKHIEDYEWKHLPKERQFICWKKKDICPDFSTDQCFDELARDFEEMVSLFDKHIPTTVVS